MMTEGYCRRGYSKVTSKRYHEAEKDFLKALEIEKEINKANEKEGTKI